MSDSRWRRLSTTNSRTVERARDLICKQYCDLPLLLRWVGDLRRGGHQEVTEHACSSPQEQRDVLVLRKSDPVDVDL